MYKYEFYLRNHWWVDAGITGFFNIAKDRNLQEKYNVEVCPESNKLIIEYKDEDEIRNFLSECYEILANRYWNVSTKKQIENPENIFYDKEADELYLGPKVNPSPIPKLFTKKYREESIEFDQLNESMKARVTGYMEETGKKLYGNKQKLLFTKPVCHKLVKLLPEEKKRKSKCSVCGKESSNCEEISQTAFLLFASSTAAKSFNSDLGKPDKICWECEYLSKFAVEAASYRKSGENLFILQMSSPSLEKNIDLSSEIGCSSVMRELDTEQFYTNIRKDEKTLIQKTQDAYEFLWAFFYDTYTTIKQNQKIDNKDDIENLLDLTMFQVPVKIILLNLVSKGQTFLTKDLFIYNDLTYIYRLLNLLYEEEVNVRSVFNSLYNKADKNMETYFRNRFFAKVLKKKSVLRSSEQFAFHMSRGSDRPNFRELLKFIKIYENVIKTNYVKSR